MSPPAAHTDQLHLARAIELAESGRGRVSPNPLVGAVIAARSWSWGRASTAAGRPPRRGRRDRRRRRPGPRRGDDVRVAGALLPPRSHAAVHRRDPQCWDRPGRGRLRRSFRARLGPRPGDPARRGDRGRRRRRRSGASRPVAEPVVPQARAHRAPLGPVRVRDDARREVATRTGDSKWISSEPSRELAHHWRAECDAVAVGIGTALADDPQLTARLRACPASPAAWCSTRSRGCRWTPSWYWPPGGSRSRSLSRVPLLVPPPTPWTPRRRRDRGHRRERAGPRALGARPARLRRVGSILLEGGPHLAGAFLDAQEVDEIRLFLAPIVLGGRTGRDPLEGEGAELIAGASRALSFECEHIGVDLLVSARLKEW